MPESYCRKLKECHNVWAHKALSLLVALVVLSTSVTGQCPAWADSPSDPTQAKQAPTGFPQSDFGARQSFAEDHVAQANAGLNAPDLNFRGTPEEGLQPNLEGLVGYWNFDSSQTGTASDYQGQYDGTVQGATQVDGRFGSGMKFDGLSENIQVEMEAGRLGQFTTSVWIKPDKYKISYILHKGTTSGEEFALRTVNDGSLYVNMSTDMGSVGFQSGHYVLNEWQLITLTWDNSNVRLYTNGKEVGSAKLSGTRLSSSDPNDKRSEQLYFGSYFYGGIQNFEGEIDDIAIFDRALDQSEINLLSQGPAISQLFSRNRDPRLSDPNSVLRDSGIGSGSRSSAPSLVKTLQNSFKTNYLRGRQFTQTISPFLLIAGLTSTNTLRSNRYFLDGPFMALKFQRPNSPLHNVLGWGLKRPLSIFTTVLHLILGPGQKSMSAKNALNRNLSFFEKTAALTKTLATHTLNLLERTELLDFSLLRALFGQWQSELENTFKNQILAMIPVYAELQKLFSPIARELAILMASQPSIPESDTITPEEIKAVIAWMENLDAAFDAAQSRLATDSGLGQALRQRIVAFGNTRASRYQAMSLKLESENEKKSKESVLAFLVDLHKLIKSEEAVHIGKGEIFIDMAREDIL